MTGRSDFAFVQVRLQSRYGQRADDSVWMKMRNIDDLASYLQVAQQTPLRHWVLGLSSTHNSHMIELALREKYRRHVDEVSGWMPAGWKMSVQWTKRLADLPALQHLLAGGASNDWMKVDSEISAFSSDDIASRLQAMRDADCSSLVNAWQKGETMSAGWLTYWKEITPQTMKFKAGLSELKRLLQQDMFTDAASSSTVNYDVITNRLRIILRRYAFQPAAVFAYLAIVAIDLHRIRGDLIQRLFFQKYENLEQRLS